MAIADLRSFYFFTAVITVITAVSYFYFAHSYIYIFIGVNVRTFEVIFDRYR
jgi:hypothetical protein